MISRCQTLQALIPGHGYTASSSCGVRWNAGYYYYVPPLSYVHHRSNAIISVLSCIRVRDKEDGRAQQSMPSLPWSATNVAKGDRACSRKSNRRCFTACW